MEAHDMDCKNCESQQACVPFFVHENTMMHYSNANKRMMIIVLTVCAVLVLTIGAFVVGYTVRTERWLKTLESITAQQEARNGIQQHSDPLSH